ncbi:MAG: S8 family serine peptidase [Desulfofustis sp.]|jgi:bacillopeptidase F|nr:S8 family serine peptidase [Desulfofustis sp.]
MKRHLTHKRLLMVMAVCLLVVPALEPVYAANIDLPLSQAMAAADPDAAIPVIIRLTGDAHPSSAHGGAVAAGKLAELMQTQSAASQGLLRAFLNSQGITKIISLWIINGFAVSLTLDQIVQIAGRPDVASIVLDDVIPVPAMPEASSAAIIDGAWDNLGTIHAPALWLSGIDGSGVVVATMDTGVDPNHPDLADKYRGGSNSWYDPNGQHPSPYDASGHGTQVMGIMVGGSAGDRATGVAPGARWIAAKIFNDAGFASYSAIHLAFQWTLNPDGLPDTADHPDIVNNSWGLVNAVGQCVSEFRQDVQVLKNAGIAVVFSGGNYGPADNTSVSPANYPESFAVGAVDVTLTASTTGSRGPSRCDDTIFPEASAPGIGIFTTDRTFGGTYPYSYVLATGSSFAAPHVSGAMALLKDAHPGATVGDLESVLIDTAKDLGTIGADNTYGYGVIDVAAAEGQLTTPAGCLDTDSDGYFNAAGCGTAVDCNDADAAINPSSAEVRLDGIDQNCNGYDLTILVTAATYFTSEDKLSVTATSAYKASAAIVLAGYGAMKYDRKKNLWSISASGVGGNPGKVIVSGMEGATTAAVTVQSSSGGKGRK